MTRVAGMAVLITGGASGIGLLVGRRLLAAGAARLVVWDVHRAALSAVVAELAAAGYDVRGDLVDVADPVQVRDAVRELEAAGIVVDVLVNNAGIVVGREFLDHSEADIARTMAVNAVGPMQLARALLPSMVARRRGHVVNVASAAGMVANPRMSVYCGSKWAMLGWSDSLRIEMERARTGVRVTTVVPYYIDTGMFAGVRSRVLPILRPEVVADRIVRAIAEDRVLLRMPSILNLLPLVQGLLPTRWFDRVVGDWFGVYSTMRHFRGRT